MRRFFFSRATQKELINEDLPETEFQSGTELIRTVPVRLRFFKLTASGSRWIGAQREITYDGEPILVRESRGNFSHTFIKSRRRGLTQLLAPKLSIMGVPDDEQPAILRKTIQVAQVAVPGVPISVIIVDVTVRLAPSIAMVVDYFRIVTSFADVNYQLIIDGVAWEFMETYSSLFKTIPAAKSSIEGLDKLRLDCLEEATIRQASRCVICLEDFDHLDAHVQEEEDQLVVLTHLPCSHLYHRECVVRWLETCNFCPLCHYPMPTEEPPAAKARTVEAGELPKPSWKDHWRLMLMVSHRIITMTLVCRVLSSQKVISCDQLLNYVDLLFF